MTPAIAPDLGRDKPGRSLVRLYRRFAAIPARTRWAVGFGGAIAFGGVFGAAGLLAWVLAVSVVTDLMWRRSFNAVVGPAFLCVVGMHLAGWSRGLPTLAESALGFAACFGLMVGLYLVFRGGEGDLKLAAVLGATLGAYHGVEALVAGYVLAAAASLVVVAVRLTRRALRLPTDPRVLAGTLPMAPFFAAGVAFTLAF